MTSKSLYPILTFVALVLQPSVTGHGRLLRPASRSSIWRFSEFQNQSPPPNYGDNELFCGGLHQADNPGTNCGVCGDPQTERPPRANEIGGHYYRGIITGRYSPGQIIDVEVEVTATHLGYMEWRLCTNPVTETQDCFNQNLLCKADGQGTSVPVINAGMYRTKLKLPQGVRCDKCILQWNYRTGNNWGYCENGTSGLGCGPQENFRGCADISIQ